MLYVLLVSIVADSVFNYTSKITNRKVNLTYIPFIKCVLVKTLFNFWHQSSVYKALRYSIESQGFTEDQDKEKDNDSQDH